MLGSTKSSEMSANELRFSRRIIHAAGQGVQQELLSGHVVVRTLRCLRHAVEQSICYTCPDLPFLTGERAELSVKWAKKTHGNFEIILPVPVNVLSQERKRHRIFVRLSRHVYSIDWIDRFIPSSSHRFPNVPIKSQYCTMYTMNSSRLGQSHSTNEESTQILTCKELLWLTRAISFSMSAAGSFRPRPC